MKDKKKFSWFLALAFLPMLFTLILGFMGVVDRFENSSIDFRNRFFNPNHKFSDKVVLVEVDEMTMKRLSTEKLFGRWPWRRQVYKPILEYIGLMAPKLILFDIMFFESSHIEEDDIDLANVTARLQNISHAINVTNDSLDEVQRNYLLSHLPPNLNNFKLDYIQNKEKLKFKSLSNVEYPVEVIMRNTPHIHSVHYDADPDGVARRLPLFQNFEGNFFPTLSFKAFSALSPVKDVVCESDQLTIHAEGFTRIVPVEEDKMRLHYYSEEQVKSIPSYSIGGIVDSSRALEAGEIDDLAKAIVNPEVFSNKVVIIGTSAAATFDTKLSPYGNIPGFKLHAIAISNLLEGHFLNLADKWVQFVVVLLTVPLAVYFSFYFQVLSLRVLLPFLIFIGYVGVALFAFKFDVHLPMAAFVTTYPIAFLGSLGYLTFTEGAERRKYSKVLSNMVDPTIVSEALNDLEAIKKGGEKQITAFFSDVASFSTISEQLTSAQLAALLNEYLSAMTIILKQHHGTLDKYIGDAVVGIFGAPLDRKEHFLDATRASLEMIAKLKELKKFWTENNMYIKDAQEMDIRIGLNTGIAKVGFMGTDSLASYTMMGDTVNLAARLEAAGKDYGVNILISESTYQQVKEEMFTKLLDAVVVKGKHEPVRIYELIGLKGQVDEITVRSANLYEEAFELHLQRNWDAAIAKFKESTKVRGKKDKSAAMLIERCEEYKVSPPPENWNGSFTRTHK